MSRSNSSAVIATGLIIHAAVLAAYGRTLVACHLLSLALLWLLPFRTLAGRSDPFFTVCRGPCRHAHMGTWGRVTVTCTLHVGGWQRDAALHVLVV